MGCNKDSEFDLFLTEFNEHVTKSTITRVELKYTGIDMRVDREAHEIELYPYEPCCQSKSSRAQPSE